MFYIGKSADGSDAYPWGGMFVSPDGKEWSNQPYTREQLEEDREQRRLKRIHLEVMEHINGKRSLRDEYDLIKAKKSSLSARCKNYVITIIESET